MQRKTPRRVCRRPERERLHKSDMQKKRAAARRPAAHPLASSRVTTSREPPVRESAVSRRVERAHLRQRSGLEVQPVQRTARAGRLRLRWRDRRRRRRCRSRIAREREHRMLVSVSEACLPPSPCRRRRRARELPGCRATTRRRLEASPRHGNRCCCNYEAGCLRPQRAHKRPAREHESRCSRGDVADAHTREAAALICLAEILPPASRAACRWWRRKQASWLLARLAPLLDLGVPAIRTMGSSPIATRLSFSNASRAGSAASAAVESSTLTLRRMSTCPHDDRRSSAP